eukprot:TRINITY_DN21050_c0_g1_i1.p1 TRINITY_DN21050_c0_g1~~TRINITY_DN21050_c0_g1_i1.p1  ORF type:complete len:190 (-),score=13.20 TRINITY_DN21050_c0_g1_i1:10-579(-)
MNKISAEQMNAFIIIFLELVLIILISQLVEFDAAVLSPYAGDVVANRIFLSEMQPFQKGSQIFTCLGFIFFYSCICKRTLLFGLTNFFAAGLLPQIYIVCAASWDRILRNDWAPGTIDVTVLVAAQSCFVSVLVSTGFFIGKVDFLLTILIGGFQVLSYALNEAICSNLLQATDTVSYTHLTLPTIYSV